MIKVFKDYNCDIKESCDICVIGTGAGGAVVAKELAEKGYSVIVLEEGGNNPAGSQESKPISSVSRMWRDGAITGTVGNPFVSVTLGKGIGGTTAINSATCFRTPDKIMKSWEKDLGLKSINKETMEPYFTKVEKEINVSTLSWDVLGNCAKIIKRGSDKLGLHCEPLKHNVINCKGHGVCQMGCPESAKQSTDVSYIPKAIKAGAKVFANCKAEKIIFDGKNTRGVRGHIVNPEKDDKKIFKVEILSKIVVVSCGSLITPQFLKKNKVKNREIGKHLQIHPAGRVTAIMDEEVNGWNGVSQGGYVSDYEDEGIALEGIFVHPAMLLGAMPGVGFKHKELAVQASKIAAFGTMIHDSTEGRVYPWRPFGLIIAKYMMKKIDMEKFKKAIVYTAKIFFAAGAKKVFTGIAKMPELNSLEDCDKLMKAKIKPNSMEILAFHPLGTCRMAIDKSNGVVDESGEVFGYKNLYVADGSIVPTSLGVNPQVTIMSLSTMISEKIDARLKS